MLRRIHLFLSRLFRRKTYREAVLAEKPVMFLPLDVQLYDRVLSADEIKEHYEQSAESAVPDLWHNRNVVYYQLNEESGTVVRDLSGHGYDAELRRERE